MPLLIPSPKATGKADMCQRWAGCREWLWLKQARALGCLSPKQTDGPPATRHCEPTGSSAIGALSWEPTKCQDWGYVGESLVTAGAAVA